MATIDESTVSPRQFHHRRFPHLQPLSPRVPSSIERHFEQYLIDNHHYPKLPSISKQANRQSIENTFINDKDFLSYVTNRKGHQGKVTWERDECNQK
ncbi:unnamed protein product, partial [Rotaria sp. Silwood2]